MTVEEKFEIYFPKVIIPNHAYNIIEFFDRDTFEYTETQQVELVDLSKIKGTWYDRYAKDDRRWIDMLEYLDRIDLSDFKPEKIHRILHEYKTCNIDLARINGTADYFIKGGGHHRISLWKLSGMGFKFLPVFVATFMK